MDLGTLRNVITRLAYYHGPGKRTRIIWHGGEPLLMGIDFFRAAVEVQRELGPDFPFENSIQTNATLLTDQMLDFCQEHQFTLGTSLDGPAWQHNTTRPYADGRASHDAILRAISAIKARTGLESKGGLGGGVIAILSKPLLPHLDQFYEFFRDNEINVKINPIFYAGRGATARDALGITPSEYADAMIHIFDRWFGDPACRIAIDPFNLILGNLMTGHLWGCEFLSACWDAYISVDPLGNVQPCGRWSSAEPFCMGNLNDQDMATIRRSPVLEQFRRARSVAAQGCNGCEYESVCNAGCPEFGYLSRGRLEDKDIYCAGYKRIFGHLKTALRSHLDGAQVARNERPQGQIAKMMGMHIDLGRVENPVLQTVIRQRTVVVESRVAKDGHQVEFGGPHKQHSRHWGRFGCEADDSAGDSYSDYKAGPP
jgi:uncharacterized protein